MKTTLKRFAQHIFTFFTLISFTEFTDAYSNDLNSQKAHKQQKAMNNKFNSQDINSDNSKVGSIERNLSRSSTKMETKPSLSNPSYRIKADQLTEEEKKTLETSRNTLVSQYKSKNQDVIANVKSLRILNERNKSSLRKVSKNELRKNRSDSKKNKTDYRELNRSKKRHDKKSKIAKNSTLNKNRRISKNYKGNSVLSKSKKTSNLLNIDLSSISEQDLSRKKINKFTRRTNLLIDKAKALKEKTEPALEAFLKSEETVGTIIEAEATVKAANTSLSIAKKIPRVGQVFTAPHTIIQPLPDKVENIKSKACSFDSKLDKPEALTQKIHDVMDTLIIHLDDMGTMVSQTYDYIDLSYRCAAETEKNRIRKSVLAGAILYQNKVGNAANAVGVVNSALDNAHAKLVEIENSLMESMEPITEPYKEALTNLAPLNDLGNALTEEVTLPWIGPTSDLGCPDGSDLYGGMCYTSECNGFTASDGWIGEKRTAVCTCNGCKTTMDCPFDQQIVLGDVECKKWGTESWQECPFGEQIVAGGVECKKWKTVKEWDWCPFGHCSNGKKCKDYLGNCVGNRGSKNKNVCDKYYSEGECKKSLVTKTKDVCEDYYVAGECKKSLVTKTKDVCEDYYAAGECKVDRIPTEHCYDWTDCGQFGYAYASWDDGGPSCPSDYNNWGFFCMKGELDVSIESIFDEMQNAMDELDVLGILELVNDIIDEVVTIVLKPFMGPLDEALSELFPSWDPPIDTDQLTQDLEYELNQVYSELTSASALISNTLEEITSIDLSAIESIECVDIKEKLTKYGQNFASEKSALLQETAQNKIQNKVLGTKLGQKANAVMEKIEFFQTAIDDPINTGISFFIDENELECN